MTSSSASDKTSKRRTLMKNGTTCDSDDPTPRVSEKTASESLRSAFLDPTHTLGTPLAPGRRATFRKTTHSGEAMEADVAAGPVEDLTNADADHQTSATRSPTGPWKTLRVSHNHFENATRFQQLPQPQDFLPSIPFRKETLDLWSRLPDTQHDPPEWPGLKCSSVAAFGCSVTVRVPPLKYNVLPE